LRGFQTSHRDVKEEVRMTKTSALIFFLVCEVYILPNCLSCCVKNSCFAEEAVIVMLDGGGMLFLSKKIKRNEHMSCPVV
jgi:hypothetical protein